MGCAACEKLQSKGHGLCWKCRAVTLGRVDVKAVLNHGNGDVAWKPSCEFRAPLASECPVPCPAQQNPATACPVVQHASQAPLADRQHPLDPHTAALIERKRQAALLKRQAATSSYAQPLKWQKPADMVPKVTHCEQPRSFSNPLGKDPCPNFTQQQAPMHLQSMPAIPPILPVPTMPSAPSVRPMPPMPSMPPVLPMATAPPLLEQHSNPTLAQQAHVEKQILPHSNSTPSPRSSTSIPRDQLQSQPQQQFAKERQEFMISQPSRLLPHRVDRVPLMPNLATNHPPQTAMASTSQKHANSMINQPTPVNGMTVPVAPPLQTLSAPTLGASEVQRHDSSKPSSVLGRRLDVQLKVEASKSTPMSKVAVASILVPSDLVKEAATMLTQLPRAAADYEAHLLSGSGCRLLKCAATQFSELQQAFKALKPSVELVAPHPSVRAALQRAPEITSAEAHRKMSAILPPSFLAALMPFQIDGISFVLQRGGRALLADEMGLGKTVQAIGAAYFYRADWPALVLCPASLCLNWKAELTRWVCNVEGGVRASDVLVLLSSKDKDLLYEGVRGGVTIMSYELAQRLNDELASIKYGVVICDESHALKSADAKKTRAILPLLARALRVIMLSGTPMPSRHAEIYTTGAALCPEVFGNQRAFETRYCAGHQGRWGWDAKGSSNREELCAILHHCIMIRREKASVLTELPAKLRRQVWVNIPPYELNEITAKLKRCDLMRTSHEAPEHNSELVELYQKTGLAKAPAVLQYVETLLGDTGSQQKVLIFAHHSSVLDLLEAKLASSVGLVRIDGKTKPEERSLLSAFRDRMAWFEWPCFLFARQESDSPLPLQAVSSLQAEDRAHRISQKDCVLVNYCLAEHTLDDLMWGIAERKLSITSSTISGERAQLGCSAEKPHTKTGQRKIASAGVNRCMDIRSFLHNG